MKFKNYFKSVIGKMNGSAKRKAERIANEIRNTALIGMTGTKSGREYKVPGTNRTYIASAPGEYPANRTGELRASIKMATQVSFSGAVGIVGTNLKHGIILEGEDEEPGIRRWLTMAVNDSREKVDAILQEPMF